MQSKEDEVLKIGTSVFVANFPDHFIAKDLSNTYKQYGTSWTLLSLIEDRKQEKRENRINTGEAHKEKEVKGYSNSYANVLRGSQPMNMENNPALVLDNSCLNQHGYSNFLMGKVKDFASLSNLKVVLVKDGYDNIKLKYMGGYCVIIAFQSQEAKKRFQSNVGIGTWFSQLQQASNDFIIDGRVTWVKIEGIPLKKCDEEAIPDTKFKEEISKTNVEEVSVWQKDTHSEDTFNLYDLLNKKQDDNNKGHSVDDGLKYPLGYTPIDEKDATDEHSNKSNESKRASGVWVPNGKKLLINSVYARKELNEKKMWDYISHVMSNWKGYVVIMGDFNKVRKKAKRFGSMFNIQGADAFNLFISNAGLEEVPLAITLDRYLSDHRSILMCESHYDYGPVPFRVFHYWFEMKGFDKFAEEYWKEAPVAGTNALIKMMKKLKYLKTNVVRFLQELEKFQSLETAQKAKIKWTIEGDENFKYYHGILNRGILVDGNWIDSPRQVKSEFLSHFENQFDQPHETHLHLDMNRLNNLNFDQQADLECEVTKKELKRAVWDCGIDKSPGPDGFTFDFRPISLIRSMYKIIAKILANRLVVVLGNLVNEGEYFVLGGCLARGHCIQMYPRVYALELCTSIDVASKMAQSNLGNSFRRGPRGGEEQAQFDLMLEKVEGTSLIYMRDRWVWSLEGSGEFSVASIRRLVEDYMLAEVTSKTRWMKVVPIKVNVLAWKVKLDCLTIRLNISRRGMYIESIICPMCGDAAESTRHIFFTCHIAREILHKISRWWDVSYTEVSSYEEWLDWILNLWLSVKYKQIFEGVCYVMWWHIWSFRNKSIFGSEYPSKAVIF
nr:RNA-directed DNA polymerase, eukaryota [Tanacetum cinerariifolium]